MAAAAYKFGESCLRALNGEGGVIECAYVQSNQVMRFYLRFFEAF